MKPHLGIGRHLDIDEHPTAQDRCLCREELGHPLEHVVFEAPDVRDRRPDRHVGLLTLEHDLGIINRRAASPPPHGAWIPGSGERAQTEVASDINAVIINPDQTTLCERPNEASFNFRHEALVD